MRDSHSKFKERGLWFEIQEIEKVANHKEARGEDASFERNIIKAYKKELGVRYSNHSLGVRNQNLSD